jgi:glutamyl-tRNA synthetase
MPQQGRRKIFKVELAQVTILLFQTLKRVWSPDSLLSLRKLQFPLINTFSQIRGYLHIGHAKAALLNDYFAHEKYKGTLLLRFDDTNPSKEKEEFQDSIVQDLALMGITPDKFSNTSDYFKELYEFCIRMIKDGNAYADDTDQATMQDQRWDGLPSARRDRPVEENLALFEEMKLGTEVGLRNCIRAKISVDNPNKAMRDPVIYRCNVIPHHRTGSTWKTYPTYDFCCPIVDSMEGVTHALRTNEYRDRNPQYEWMLDALGLRKVHIWDFARMNFTRTLLSKRKLTKFVNEGAVWGWDDPRFPTIRGIRRRGMTIPALREFILKQGPSRNIVNLDWTIFWATNRKYIDPVAPRYTAISSENAVKVKILNGPAKPYFEDKPCHGKNPDLGTKQVGYSQNILVEQADAATFAQDEEITLMNWGNAFVRKITTPMNPLSSTILSIEMELHLEGDVKKTDKKITWLSEESQTKDPIELVDFDFLITKDKLEEGDEVEHFLTPKTEFRSEAISDENVGKLAQDTILQFERKGYYKVDQPAGPGQRAVLFQIPTGKTKSGI